MVLRNTQDMFLATQKRLLVYRAAAFVNVDQIGCGQTLPVRI
jgi:hypothetical protein